MRQVLVIGYVWPEPASSAAGTRMMQLLEYFQLQECSVTFATTASPTPYSEDLTAKGITVEKITLNSNTFNDFIEKLSPEFVVYDRYMMEEQFGWRVAQTCPDALTILDTEDLHFLRQFRQKKMKDPNLPESALKDSELAMREIASIYRCDLSLIISEAEMNLLKNNFQLPEDLLLYLPFMQEQITSEVKKALPSFEDRNDFISIGNFKHTPNVDAVQYLKKEIWPLIHKKLPEAKMLIYGAYPTLGIQQLHEPKMNFLVKGRAENAGEVVRAAKVSLASLRYGAGLKGKITEAIQCGTPVVTTETGAEGMLGRNENKLKIASTPTEFAETAISLYISKEKWSKAAENGLELINRLFSKQHFHDILTARINLTKEHLEEHRRKNFTGAMLKQHYSRSTYFLSKYIELKNELENIKGK